MRKNIPTMKKKMNFIMKTEQILKVVSILVLLPLFRPFVEQVCNMTILQLRANLLAIETEDT